MRNSISIKIGDELPSIEDYVDTKDLDRINNKTIEWININLEDNKKLIITSVILTVGVSGVFLFSQSFAGVSLAMVLGVLLNLILRNKNKPLDLN